MILPERVLGTPGANCSLSSEAIAPISLRTCAMSSLCSSSEPVGLIVDQRILLPRRLNPVNRALDTVVSLENTPGHRRVESLRLRDIRSSAAGYRAAPWRFR